MIRFIWLGAAVMALGGLTTLFDRRYKLAPVKSDATAEVSGAAGGAGGSSTVTATQ
jgi:hypothetical protein